MNNYLQHFIFTILVCFSTSSYGYDISWYDDLSSEFYISSAESLQGLSMLCKQGKVFENKVIHITDDIDMKGLSWNVIPDFSGTIEGHGRCIKNLSYTCENNDWNTKVSSFISTLTTTGIISNLKFTNEYMEMYTEYVGACVAGVVYYNKGLVVNCEVEGVIQGLYKGTTTICESDYYSGGIVGYNNGKVYNCVFYGSVKSLANYYSQSPQAYAGGIVGYNEGEIINCINYGDIISRVGNDSSGWTGARPHAYSGGICGSNTSVIENVINYGTVKAESVQLGQNEIKNAYASAIVAQGECLNSYYLSSSQITAPLIVTQGTMLSESQITNKTYNFTSLLNNNVNNMNKDDVLYWANANSYNDNRPFILNIFSMSNSVSNLNEHSATFISSPTDISSTVILSKGFDYKKINSTSYNHVNIGNDSFQSFVTGLEASESYEMFSWITTSKGRIESNPITFKMNGISVTTLLATEITPTSAVLNGDISVGTMGISSQGFVWKKTISDNYNIEYTNGTEFTKEVKNLTPNTDYIYQAFIMDNSGNSYYGNEMTFHTSPIALTCNVSQGSNPNQCEIYGEINTPIITNVIVEYKQDTDATYKRMSLKSNTYGQFSLSLDGLLSNTNYMFRAYIVVDNVYIYSNSLNYKTINTIINTLDPILGKHVTLRGEAIGANQNGKVGFEYRETMHPDIIPSVIKYAEIINGNFSLNIVDVENFKEYKYRAFYEDQESNKYYGAWQLFMPTNVDPTDIVSIINEQNTSNFKYYDISGAPLTYPHKGIIILNGKKIIVK